jgi:hypothetical protein
MRVASVTRRDQFRPQHFLYFLPEPQGQGSLRPTLPGGAAKDEGGVGKFGDEAH